jgi:MFS family permease
MSLIMVSLNTGRLVVLSREARCAAIRVHSGGCSNAAGLTNTPIRYRTCGAPHIVKFRGLGASGRVNVGQGTLMTVQGLGASLSPALGGFIAQHFGYRLTFLMLGSFAVGSFVLWTLFTPVLKSVCQSAQYKNTFKRLKPTLGLDCCRRRADVRAGTVSAEPGAMLLICSVSCSIKRARRSLAVARFRRSSPPTRRRSLSVLNAE